MGFLKPRKESYPVPPEGAASNIPAAAPQAIKYPKPKVLLIGLDLAAGKTLRAEGFNVQTGTFGKPFQVAKSSGHAVVVGNASLPNFTEQEVVVVDLDAGTYDLG